MKEIMLQGIDLQEFKEIIRAIIKEELTGLVDSINKEDKDELLTREETIQLLKIDPSTLWHWTKKGKIKAYGIGNRKYFKRKEILESLHPVKVGLVLGLFLLLSSSYLFNFNNFMLW